MLDDNNNDDDEKRFYLIIRLQEERIEPNLIYIELVSIDSFFFCYVQLKIKIEKIEKMKISKWKSLLKNS